MTHTRALPLALIQLEVPPPQVVAQIGEQPAGLLMRCNCSLKTM